MGRIEFIQLQVERVVALTGKIKCGQAFKRMKKIRLLHLLLLFATETTGSPVQLCKFNGTFSVSYFIS